MTRTNAIEAALRWLDERRSREADVRKATGVPSVDAFKEAFEVIDINASERAMLEAHIAAPFHTMTATELAAAARSDSWSIANLHYGGLGRKLAEAMRWTPLRRPDGTEIWTTTLATAPRDAEGADEDEIRMERLMATVEHDGHFEWQLRRQVAEAWAKLSAAPSL